MMDRRGFLKFGAGVTTGLVASPIIWNTLQSAVYWTQSWSWIPRLQYGANEYIATVSKLCPSGTGIRVRLVEGRPVRALGDPENPISQGGLTALAAAETQLQVSPARLKRPLKRGPDGGLTAISWDEARALLAEKMKDAGSSVACLSGDDNGVINEVFSALLELAGSNDFYLLPGEEQPAHAAWKQMGGKGRIGYDVENSDFIVAIGANFLESWGTVVRNRKAFGAGHPTGEDPTMKLVYAGPVENNTAVGADQWLPIRPGTEAALAMGIAKLLLDAGKAFPFMPGLGDFSALAAAYTPAKVQEITGLPAETLQALVKELMAAEKPLVIVGSEMGQGGAAGPVMAGIAVNTLLGRVGQEGNLVDLPYPPKVLTKAMSFRQMLEKDFVKYSRAVADGAAPAPKLLMIYEANPLYALPPAAKVAEWMGKAGFKVAFSGFLDESTAKCDLILPAAFGIERFDDVYTPYGSGFVSYAIARPVTPPLFDALPASDILFGLAQEMEWADYFPEDMPTLISQRAMLIGADPDTMMESGEVFTADRPENFTVPYINAASLSAAMSDAPSGLAVAPVTVLGMGTPETGIPPFATRIITDYQLVGRYMVGQMNAATASKLGVRAGDMLKLGNDQGSVTVQVALFEGILPDTVALPTGLGHTAFDEFSQNKGDNIMQLTGISEEPGTGLSVWGAMSVNAVKA